MRISLPAFIKKILHYAVAGIALCILCPVFSYAQATKVSGSVTDALTNEPLPFVNVVFKGTTVGITSDMNGKFSLETQAPSDSLVASFVGYLSVAMHVQKGRVQVINFALKTNKVDLPEVNILAGENPAVILIKKVLDNKKNNDREQQEAYQYEVYNKVEFDITDINEKFMNNRLIKPFAFIFDNIDSTATNKKPFLPFFISETLSDFYYIKNPKAEKEIIKGSKVSGVDNKSVTQFMGDMYQKINIYDNFIDLFGKNLVSPVSNVGLLYYKYYLLDSLFINGHWCYKLKFKPRRKQELTFLGELWVADTSFAIKKIDMRIVPDANINFVEDLAIVQEYAFADNKAWMLTKDMLVVDFSVREEGVGFIGRKTTTYRDFVFDKPKPAVFFASGERVELTEDASEKDMAYWSASRHDSLSAREQKIYAMVDTIKTLPAFKTYVDIVTMFVTGYKVWGYFELGPYFNVFSFNPIEGPRFRFGGRTSNKFSVNLELNGYLAYGVRDDKFKYGGGFRYFLSKKPRQSIGASYKNDVEQLGLSENAFQDDNIFASLFSRNPSAKLTTIVEEKVYYEYEWVPGFSNKITFTHREYTPLGSLDYSYYVNDAKNITKNMLNTTEISFMTRFAYKENFVSGKMDRISLGTKYPVLQLNYTLGIKDAIHSDFSYHKVVFKIDDTYKMGPLGYNYYVLETGKIWGTLPYPLLEVHKGNQTYSYDYLAFNMMNYYEFVSDAYVSFFSTQHFDGLLLDKIPLMRKLKWREVATFKGLIGSVTKKNEDILVTPDSFSTLSKPYIEVGAGVENIFKIFRIDGIWRMSYLNHPNVAPFGIRGSLQLTF